LARKDSLEAVAVIGERISGRARRIETSNASENDLAAFLLVRGYLEGQL